QGGFLGCIRMCEELAASRKGIFLPRQFSNPANVEAHEETTGPEILSQMVSVAKRPQAFVAGVGTGGTVMGVGKFLKERDSSIRIHPVEPAESPTLSTGCKVGSTASRAFPTNSCPKSSSFRNSTRSSPSPMATPSSWRRNSL